MPSVRVRSKTYTPVHEVFAQADPGDVAEAQNSPTEGAPIPRFSFLHDRMRTAPFPAPGRPRAATLSSRVHAHCTLRNSGSINSRSPTSPVIPLVNEHPQPAEESNRPGIRHPPGRAESSINLSHGGSDNFWDSFNPDHHHDDVVEHLDVIGTYSSHGYTPQLISR